MLFNVIWVALVVVILSTIAVLLTRASDRKDMYRSIQLAVTKTCEKRGSMTYPVFQRMLMEWLSVNKFWVSTYGDNYYIATRADFFPPYQNDLNPYMFRIARNKPMILNGIGILMSYSDWLLAVKLVQRLDAGEEVPAGNYLWNGSESKEPKQTTQSLPK